jgi:hypothetical protein
VKRSWVEDVAVANQVSIFLLPNQEAEDLLAGIDELDAAGLGAALTQYGVLISPQAPFLCYRSTLYYKVHALAQVGAMVRHRGEVTCAWFLGCCRMPARAAKKGLSCCCCRFSGTLRPPWH